MKVAVIGASFAQVAYLPALAHVPGAKVVAIASARLSSARAAAEKFAIPHATDDWEAMLDTHAPDLVCIATPTVLHAPQTLKALARGAHVLCEKPTAMNAAEAAVMRDAAAAAGRIAMIDHELRFNPNRRRIARMIREGDLGEIRHVNIANIGSQLSNGTTGFGSSWYDSTSLWMGAAAVRSTGTTTTTQVNGDPNRTLYISQGRSTAGTAGSANSAGWGGFSNGDMTTGATAINNAVNRMETQSSTTTLVEGTATSNFDNQNPFNILGQPVTSYGIFPGGVMASFGASNLGSLGGVTGVEAALDLYRILATTNPSGTVVESGESAFNGSFQGTFVINSSGDVSYLAPVAVPEPTTMGATLALGLVAAGIRRRRRVAA